jgi:hypothetical protein
MALRSGNEKLAQFHAVPTTLVAVCALILAGLASLVSGSCTSSGSNVSAVADGRATEAQIPGQIYYVSSAAGLVLREKPEVSGRKIILIPFAAKVTTEAGYSVKAQVDGIAAKWIPVRWAGKSGYVFDGYLISNAADLLAGKVFSDGLNCTGKTHSEFTWHLFFLPDFRYRIEHISPYGMVGCTLEHKAEGTYEFTPNALLLKPLSTSNFVRGGTNCPQDIPQEIRNGYAHVDGGKYVVKKCDGKTAFARDPQSREHFVFIGTLP